MYMEVVSFTVLILFVYFFNFDIPTCSFILLYLFLFFIGCQMSQNCFVLPALLLPLLIYYIRHPISYQTSDILYPTSDILYPTSDIISDVGYSVGLGIVRVIIHVV